MKTLKIVSLTVIATLLIEVIAAYSFYKLEIEPNQEMALKKISSSRGNLSCFPNQRSGVMNKNENELFIEIRQACIESNIEKLNSYLFITEDELQIECTNNESTFYEPNVPIAKFSILNTSNRPIPLIDYDVKNMGWSTSAENGRWSLEYELGMKDNPTHIKILQPGEKHDGEFRLDVRGYGKQDIKYYFHYPKWLKLSSSSSSQSAITAARKTCTYYWKEKV